MGRSHPGGPDGALSLENTAGVRATGHRLLMSWLWVKAQHQTYQSHVASGGAGIGGRGLFLQCVLDLGLEFEISCKGNNRLLEDLKVIKPAFKKRKLLWFLGGQHFVDE